MNNTTYIINKEIIFSVTLFRLSIKNKDIKLSNKEAELLEALCSRAGFVIPRSELQDTLWPNQDNNDTNLNRHILSLRRKLESFGLMDAIDTIPRVGYIFLAPIEATIETETNASDEEAKIEPTPRIHSRLKYDFHFNHKRIFLFLLLLCPIIPITFKLYFLATENKLNSINSKHVTLYVYSETKRLLNIDTDALLPLIQRISRKSDEQISILIGKDAISYFSIDNNSLIVSENVFLLRSGHPIIDEVQCVITTMNRQGDNVSYNNYNNPYITIRYHSNCLATEDWVDVTRKSKLTTTINRNIVTATIIATDRKGTILFNIDTVEELERANKYTSVELKNSIVNYIDQAALTKNSTMAILLAARILPKSKLYIIPLPGDIYLSSYLGGIITWYNAEHYTQHNNL